jgi:hypothetical protein
MNKNEKGLEAFKKMQAIDKREKDYNEIIEDIESLLKKIKEVTVTKKMGNYFPFFELRPSNKVQDKFYIRIELNANKKSVEIDWTDGGQVRDSAEVQKGRLAAKLKVLIKKLSGGNAARNKELGLRISQERTGRSTSPKKPKTTQKKLAMSDRSKNKTAARKERTAASRSARAAAKQPTESQIKAAAARATKAAEKKADAARERAAKAAKKKAAAAQARIEKKIQTAETRIEKYKADKTALAAQLAEMRKMAKIIVI